MALHVVHWPGTGHRGPFVAGPGRHRLRVVAQRCRRRGTISCSPIPATSRPIQRDGRWQRTATIDTDAAVYLIRKDELLATPVGAPVVPTPCRVAPTTGHYFGCWDDDDGVRIIFEHMDLMDLGTRSNRMISMPTAEPIDPGLVGFYNTAMAPNSCSEVVFDPQTGTSRQDGPVPRRADLQPRTVRHGLVVRGHLGTDDASHRLPGVPSRCGRPASAGTYGERVPALPPRTRPVDSCRCVGGPRAGGRVLLRRRRRSRDVADIRSPAAEGPDRCRRPEPLRR